MKKALFEAIDDKGVNEFFSKLNKDKLVIICKSLKLTETGDKPALIKRIQEEVIQRGINAFFSQFSERELQQWCDDSGLNVTAGGKKNLIAALVDQKDVKPQKKKPNRKKSVKLKWPWKLAFLLMMYLTGTP